MCGGGGGAGGGEKAHLQDPSNPHDLKIGPQLAKSKINQAESTGLPPPTSPNKSLVSVA